jgi:1,4-dihydroxy-6-naphthoate synthase
MNLTLGFSPCPNDTFIFDSLVNGKFDSEGLKFNVVMEDVETLNKWALEGKLDITKLSFPAFFQSLDEYRLLNSGSALGKGVGPLLISKTPIDPGKIEDSTIAIPGFHTTANLLLSFAYPAARKREAKIFSDIETSVLEERTDLGVIIHENRFTYQQKGLHKVRDLGEYWEEKMQLPIPLGAIAIRRTIPLDIAEKVNEMIRKSIENSYKTYPMISDFIRENSQEMDESVMRKHIELYVNEFSIDLGEAGKNAINVLYEIYLDMTKEGKKFSKKEIYLN